MNRQKVIRFVTVLAWIWVLIYASEYKEPDCFVGTVLARERTVNQLTGKYRYQITVRDFYGETISTTRATSGGYALAGQGEILFCQTTGRFTRIKSPWYTY